MGYSRRTFIRMSGLAAGAGILAACGRGGDPAGAPTTPATNGANGANGANGNGRVVTYWNFFDPEGDTPREVAQAQILEAFTEDTGIEVNYVVVPFQEMGSQFLRAAQAGDAPDVARVNFGEDRLLAQAGATLPLDDFFAEFSAEEQQDFVTPPETALIDGQRFAMQYGLRNDTTLYYRRDWLQEAGFETPPPSWVDIQEAAAALASERRSGFIMPFGRPPYSLNFWFVGQLHARGGAYVDEEGRAAFNSDAGREAMQWLVDAAEQGAFPPAEAAALTDVDVLDGIRASTVAMTMNGNHILSTARDGEGVGDNIQITHNPPAEPGGEDPTPLVDSAQLVIGRESQEPDAAWELIRHMISPEMELLNAEVASELPSRRSVYEEDFFQQEENAELLAVGESLFGQPQFPFPARFTEVSAIVADAFEQAVVDGRPVDEALAEAEQAFNDAL